MASHYWTEFPEKKVTAGTPAKYRSGSTPSMPQKQGYAKPNLPGPASHAFAGPKKGVKEVNGYANYQGLSKAHPGFKAVQAKIAAKEGISQDRAGAILAASSRGASKAAHKKNPRLNRVKG